MNVRVFHLALVATLAIAAGACATKFTAVDRGFEAFSKQDYVTAEREFTEALRDNPNNPYAQLNMAAVYQNTGRLQEAIPLYEKVLVTGRRIRPSRKANTTKGNPTLAELAQANLNAIITGGKSVGLE